MISPSFNLDWYDPSPTFYDDTRPIHIENEDSTTVVTNIGEVKCVRITNPYGAPWLYVCLPPSGRSIGKKVLVEVTLLCNDSSDIWIEYDSFDSSIQVVPDMVGAFKGTAKQSVRNTDEFSTFTFYISDARFSKRINGADFRIVMARDKGAPMFVERVSVKQAYQKDNTSNIDGGIRFKSPDNPTYSIIIPVHNKAEYTLQCLQSLYCNSAKRYEVILVDDGSNAFNRKMLEQIEGIKYLYQKQQGFAKACNNGASVARSELLIFLNNDTVVIEGWDVEIIRALKRIECAGVVGPKLIYPATREIQHAGISFDDLHLPHHDYRYKHRDYTLANFTRSVPAVTGACLLTYKRLFNKLDGFDERYTNGYEDIDYCMKVRQADYEIYYCPASVLYHYEAVTSGRRNYFQESENRVIFQKKWHKMITKYKDSLCNTESGVNTSDTRLQECTVKPRLIAFFQPRFHSVPENELGRKKGFTEWTSVTKATPFFDNHYQPRLPTDLGFYDLMLPEIRDAQAQLAKEYGLFGFCYYYYWFNGKKLFEGPIQEVLNSGKPDFPFCICWANENWPRRWEGSEHKVLSAKVYSDEIDLAFIHDIAPILRDDRYIKVNNKSILLIFRADIMPDPSRTIALWRQECLDLGVGDLVIASCSTYSNVHSLPDGFDVAVDFPPHNVSLPNVHVADTISKRSFSGVIHDYHETVRCLIEKPKPDHPHFRTAMLGWDSTPRLGTKAKVFHGFSPESYKLLLEHLINTAAKNAHSLEPLVFINAWNEWTQGCYLEPDRKFDYKILEATYDALIGVNAVAKI